MTADERRAVAAHLWDEHMQAGFPPRLRGESIAGVEMVLLDADTAGCVETWLGGSGGLDRHRQEMLESCLADLDRVAPLLNDQSERSYFERLRELATLALG